ncbi:hypothetical protein CYA_2505 [Synechococcus sp. JA-3-3Ab]|nr:hypothetical protein CYA_2505 [Synechococcus sp. JA-3-3Ab]
MPSLLKNGERMDLATGIHLNTHTLAANSVSSK